MNKISILFTIVVFLLKKEIVGAQQLDIVETKEGTLQGVVLTSRRNRTYYGFLGISYGKIPQRFSVQSSKY